MEIAMSRVDKDNIFSIWTGKPFEILSRWTRLFGGLILDILALFFVSSPEQRLIEESRVKVIRLGMHGI